MSWQKRSICLGMSILLAMAGISLAQDTPPIIWIIQAHNHNIESVSFAADGQTIVSASSGEAKSWRTFDGSPLQTFPDQGDGIISTDISPDGQHLAVGYILTGHPPGGVVDLWDMPSETVLDTYGGCHVAFSPGGVILASGGGGVNRYAYLHEVASGEELAGFYNGPGYITDVAYSPDGHLLAVSNTQNEVILWDTRTQILARTLTGHTDDVSCIAFSPDGQLLATGAGGWDLPSDSTIKVWRVSDGELLRTMPGHGVWTNTIAFHPGGELLVSTGRDSQTPYSASMRFWNLSDGALVREYDGLAGDIAFSPDGETYCFGMTDGSLVLAGSGLSSVGDDGHDLARPTVAQLGQNFPNPFNPSTTIQFELTVPCRIDLDVFSASGRRIISLVAGRLPHGRHQIVWNGCNEAGRPMASGIYFYRLKAGATSETRRMLLVK
jgi:WD40 repeat protein